MSRLFVTLCLVSLIAGCGGGKDYDGPKRFPLSGKVTFNGENVDGGVITFTPESGENQRVSSGVISNGEYSISEGQGATQGKYRVEIRWSRPTGKQILDAEDTGEMIDVTEQVIPAKYNMNTELTADVPSSTKSYDFALTGE